MNAIVLMLATVCTLAGVQAQPHSSSSHTRPQQSEFTDPLWSGRLFQEYVRAQVTPLSPSHALCHAGAGPSSITVLRQPNGAVIGHALVNGSVAAFSPDMPSIDDYGKRRKKIVTVQVRIPLDTDAARLAPGTQLFIVQSDPSSDCL